MRNAQCLLCQAGADVDPTMTNAAIGKLFGVSKDSARRHRKHMLDVVDPFFSDIPEAIITSRGKTVRLADGSYEKVSYDPRRKALLEAHDYDDIERAIADFRFKPPVHLMVLEPITDHVCVADFQVGKTDIAGGTEELVERVLASFHRSAERIKADKPSQVVLWDLGDIIENFNNTNSQRQTNDRTLTEQIRTARRLMTEGIKLFAPLTPRLTVAAVPSNHASVRTGIGDKMQAATSDDDFGLDINYTLEEKFSEHPDFGHVQFVRPDPYLESVYLDLICGTRIAGVHGHQSKSQDKMGEWWKGQSHGRRGNLHMADMLLYGHFHNLRVQHSGDARWLIGAPTSDNGSTWFSGQTGESAKSGVLVFSTKKGQWQNLEIL